MAFDPVILPGIYPKERIKDTDHSILKKKKKRTEMLQNRKMLYHWTTMLL